MQNLVVVSHTVCARVRDPRNLGMLTNNTKFGCSRSNHMDVGMGSKNLGVAGAHSPWDVDVADT